MSGFLTHPLLEARGARHGFGLRGAPEPAGVLRPRQVHGVGVARARRGGDALGDADAVVCDVPDLVIGIVTADCVPILVASEGGRLVAAVHAGWRGLAAGVIEAALEALRREGARSGELAAVVGPHVGPCCYEVDEPVLERLRERFGGALDAASTRTRAGHARIDLGALARTDLGRVLAPAAIAGFAGTCTRCDAARFHSHRRDGARAGRMLHWVAASGENGG